MIRILLFNYDAVNSSIKNFPAIFSSVAGGLLAVRISEKFSQGNYAFPFSDIGWSLGIALLASLIILFLYVGVNYVFHRIFGE